MYMYMYIYIYIYIPCVFLGSRLTYGCRRPRSGLLPRGPYTPRLLLIAIITNSYYY